MTRLKENVKNTFVYREFLKNIDYLRDDAQDFSHENVHDDFEDEDNKTPNVKTTQKRDHRQEKKSKECVTFVC